jgi:hypothetical protein
MNRNARQRPFAMLLIIALLLWGLTPLHADTVYQKASEWAKPELDAAAQNGLIPQRLMGQDMTRPATREEVCELAVALYEAITGTVVAPKSPNPFTDTSNPAVLKAFALGVTSGVSATSFAPDKTITREEVATLFGRTLGKAFPGEDRTPPSTPVFEDQALISSWALEHVLHMNRIGVLKGANNRFMPRPLTPADVASGYGNTSREAAVAISLRSQVHYTDVPAQPADPATSTVSPTPVATPAVTPVPSGTPTPAVTPVPSGGPTPTPPGVFNPGLILALEPLSLVNRLSFNVVADNGMPAVKLKDNRIYPLLPLEPRLPVVEVLPANLYPTPVDVTQFQIVPPPATVDHRAVQTTIKDQAGRNTCVSFALAAAMEAVYIRKDPVRYKDIDLSEQYANYIQKMARLVDPPRPEAYLRENSLGRWGWSSILYATTLFNTYYGVPEESLLPYIAGGAYENTNQYGDDPRIDPDNNSETQRRINDVNLTAPDYSRSAIAGAKYGISKFSYLQDWQLTDPRHFENVLAAGYDVIFGMEVTGPDPTPDNNIWNAGTEKHGGHAMLMVGYDEARQVFIVKNSWGSDNPYEAGYTLLGYDQITSGNVGSAAYIVDVVTDLDAGYREEQRFLGRWNLNHDGWRGTLDINRIPDFYQNHYLAKSTFGTADNRIGTFFSHDGYTYRVNGTMEGNKIVFRIDGNNRNQDYDDMTGKPYTGYIFSRDPETIAGTFVDGGTTYGFHATQGDWLPPDASPGGAFAGAQYIGNWSLNHDGWPGTLTITSVNPLTGALSASYRNAQGEVFPVTGRVGAGGRAITFSIAFDAASPQVFNGYIYSWDRGIMSGITFWAGMPFGWVAERHDLVLQMPSIPIR